MKQHKISVIIPAHNEEKYIGKCLKAILRAKRHIHSHKVEAVVVANRCTDNTADIAKKLGARVIVNNDKCISSIRNAGVKASKGDIVITVDADSIMSEYALKSVVDMLESGEYIGGGTISKFDRMSLGILVSTVYVASKLIPEMIKSKAGLSGGMFWFFRCDFDTIGGFNETMVSVEDRDFAKRLKQLGDIKGKKYGTLKSAYITTSSRKFDEFGDWYLIKNRELTKEIFTGKNREAADKFYYDVR